MASRRASNTADEEVPENSEIHDSGIEYLVTSRKRYYSMAHAIHEDVVGTT